MSGILVLISVSMTCFSCFRRVRFLTCFKAFDKHYKQHNYTMLNIESVIMVQNKMVTMPSTVVMMHLCKNYHHLIFYHFFTKKVVKSYTNFEKKHCHISIINFIIDNDIPSILRWNVTNNNLFFRQNKSNCHDKTNSKMVLF